MGADIEKKMATPPRQWLIKTSFPVVTPGMPELHFDNTNFDLFSQDLVHPKKKKKKAQFNVALHARGNDKPIKEPKAAPVVQPAAEPANATFSTSVNTDSPLMTKVLINEATVKSLPSTLYAARLDAVGPQTICRRVSIASDHLADSKSAWW